MGLQIGDIVPRTDVSFSELKGKTLAVDAFNTIYQFISTIRQPDGTLLMDKQGRVTSHLSGLFYRNVNLLVEGIKLIYVFDGKPPALKYKTSEARQEMKNEAREKYERAKEEEDVESMGKYSRQLAYLNSEMVEEAKELLEAMGIAVVQAPSEGEAQAAWLAKNNEAYAVASQDYDSLLFGASRLIQNLTMARKRKTASGFIYISPEIIDLQKTLNNLQLSHDQLISLGILVGTDYNPGGLKGIGPKKSLALVREFKQPAIIFKNLQEQIDKQENKFDWQEIFELFHKPNVDAKAKIVFPKPDYEKVKRILLEHDFSEERIDNQLAKLLEIKERSKQRTLF
jgi:flap endonuclease-1